MATRKPSDPLACGCLIALITAATALAWVWRGTGDSPLVTIAFFAGPPLIVVLSLILYGYASEYRSERTRGLPTGREPAA
jgi:hypothetical protein